LPVIFDKAVVIGIAVAVDPAKRRLDVRPELGQRLQVAGALAIEPASMTKSGVESTLP